MSETNTKASTNSKHSTTFVSMMSRRDEAEDSLKFDEELWKKINDPYHKLEVAMRKLSQMEGDASLYGATCQRIMQHLHVQFQERRENYLPWTRLLDISLLKKESYAGKREGSPGYIFKQEMENLIKSFFFVEQDQKAPIKMDWRIAKKILSVSKIFSEDSQLLSSITKEKILQAFQTEICNASEHLIWLFPTTDRLLCLVKETLGKLLQLFQDKSSHDLLSQAIILGRFDKDNFKLNNSLVVGEDGGLYLLLNRLTKEQQKGMVQKNIATEIYLKDKIVKAEMAAKEEKGDVKKKFLTATKLCLAKVDLAK